MYWTTIWFANIQQWLRLYHEISHSNAHSTIYFDDCYFFSKNTRWRTVSIAKTGKVRYSGSSFGKLHKTRWSSQRQQPLKFRNFELWMVHARHFYIQISFSFYTLLLGVAPKPLRMTLMSTLKAMASSKFGNISTTESVHMRLYFSNKTTNINDKNWPP